MQEYEGGEASASSYYLTFCSASELAGSFSHTAGVITRSAGQDVEAFPFIIHFMYFPRLKIEGRKGATFQRAETGGNHILWLYGVQVMPATSV